MAGIFGDFCSFCGTAFTEEDVCKFCPTTKRVKENKWCAHCGLLYNEGTSCYSCFPNTRPVKKVAVLPVVLPVSTCPECGHALANQTQVCSHCESIERANLFKQLAQAVEENTAAREQSSRAEAAERRALSLQHPEASRPRYIGESEQAYYESTLRHCSACEQVTSIEFLDCSHCGFVEHKRKKINPLLLFAGGVALGNWMFSGKKKNE